MPVVHTAVVAIGFGADPVRRSLADLIDRIDAGEVVDATDEDRYVDLKEETGRRDRSGVYGPGAAQSEAVARQLAGEAACMANTPGGGALIVGVADDGALVGADTNAEWLRHRIYEVTGKLLTVDVSEHFVRDARLLIIVAPPAVEPIRINGKICWRVDSHCVEVDAATWNARRMRALNYDWSSESSYTPQSAARSQALAVARDFLAASSDPTAEDLLRSSDSQLLRRLNAVTGDGMLTNAGLLVFGGRESPSLDYVHRDYAGGDSTARVRRANRSVLEELAEVFITIDANNSVRQVQTGLVIRRIRDLPELAAREAVVNGVAHREWGSQAPTVVEHVGRTLRVTSPGGFYGGVTSTNIITHPSQSRNAALTQLLADLHVAEREGIGVDRMVREMVRLGYSPPDIREITGPFVRTSLLGDVVDVAWIEWLSSITPTDESADVYSLLILRQLTMTGWIDVTTAAPLIQLTAEEARGALTRLSRARVPSGPLLSLVTGTPDGTEPVWRLNPSALGALNAADHSTASLRSVPSRSQVARSFARARGRISSTELGSLVGASPSNVGNTLKALVADGELEPSSTTGRGRGFYYRWVGESDRTLVGD